MTITNNTTLAPALYFSRLSTHTHDTVMLDLPVSVFQLGTWILVLLAGYPWQQKLKWKTMQMQDFQQQRLKMAAK